MRIILGLIAIVLLVLLLRVGELYTQLGRYQKYWDKQNQKPIEKNDLIYIALGDSAAQGVGASSPDKGYVGMLAEELAKNTGRPVHVINLSKSGAKIKDVTDTQLAEYNALRIDNKHVITLDIGANDVVATDLRNFKKDMDKLMSKLPKQTIIADIPSFQGSRYGRLEHRVNAANKIMYELADKYGFKLAKVHDAVKANHGIRTFGGDLFHPSNHGYRTNWLPVFWERIESGKQAL